MRLMLVTCFAFLALSSCATRTSQEDEALARRLRAQEESVNAAIQLHFEALKTTPRTEVGSLLKNEGLDFMLGKSTSEFEAVFSSAFTMEEIQEIAPWWEPRERVREWMQDHTSVVFLETNIWKNIGMLQDARNADTLVIALDGDTIVNYQFFANMGY